ncbi:hypothetical protein ACHAPH_008471 [Verticillium nonalfalfae]
MSAETRRAMRSWVLGQHSPNERYEDSRRRRLPDTCGWVFTRPDFVRWSSRDSPPGTPEILWIHGRPGFGKTILCSRIVEHLSAIPDTPVAHFFFSSDHESRNEPYVVMRSWVSQLESHPASQPHVFTLVHQSWTATHDQVATRATVTQLLREALRARPRCYLVVDGLDECTAPVDSSSSVARFLEDVKDATTSATRILVISREEPEIRQALRTGDPGRVTEYHISTEDVYDDATTFSQDIVDRKLPNKSEDVRASLSKTMTDRSEGHFLWLKMLDESLRRGMNKKQLQRAIENTPTDLDHLYKRDWTRITRLGGWEKHHVFALLRWTAFALRPLTVCEITEAVLVIEFEDLPLDDLPDVVDDDYVDSEIIGLCGPLLEVRNDPADPSVGRRTVHLPHFTVRQFLLRQLPTPDWIQQNDRLQCSYEKVQNTILAKACLQYISLRQVWDDDRGSSHRK